MRKVGPLLPEHRLGRDNLRAAFPEKSAAEIEQILARRLGQSRPRRAPSSPISIELSRRRPEHFPTDTAIVDTATGTRSQYAARRQASADLRRHLANWEIAGE